METATPAFGPVAGSERLQNLDFVRGVALLGILHVNSIVFFGPLAALMEPSYQAGLSMVDRAAALAVLALCQTKFITIFSALFGYGLLGQFERADAAGRGAGRFAFRRLLPLTLFGFVHGLLLWFGDILFFYSLMGYWLLVARRARARTLLIVGFGLVAFALLFAMALMALGAAFGGAAGERPPSAMTTDLRGWSAIAASRGDVSSPAWLAAETAAYRDGPWHNAQLFRSLEWLGNVAIMLFFLGWVSLGMMFVGGAMWRLKFFAPEQRRLRLRVMGACLPVGLALSAAGAWALWPYPPPTVRDQLAGQLLIQAGVMFLPLGYLALFATLGDALPRWLAGPVCSAGRMSLTVYLSESLVCTALAYHWGFRLFGSVGPLAQVLVTLAVWAGLALLAHLWLIRFKQGPMEWLWRRLEYGRDPG